MSTRPHSVATAQDDGGSISRDAAAMWGVLAIALLVQWGLGRSIETLIGDWNVRYVWLVMALLTAASLIAAYWSPVRVMDDVFAWRGASVRWVALSGVGGVAFSGLARVAFTFRGTIPPDTLVISTTVGPLVEELLYRGFLWCVVSQVVGGQGRWGSTALVTVVSAILFAVAHTNPSLAWFWLRLSAGILAGVLRHFSASTLPPAVAHLSFNITMLG